MIREWTLSDNEAIERLERECFITPWDRKMLDDCFTNAFYGLVEEREGKIVGYVGSIFDIWEAEILLVAVDEGHRRRNIAEGLMSAIIEKHRSAGREKIFLEVRRSNIAAQGLYRKLGFVKVGVRERYYENTEDALVLCLSL